MPQLKPPTTYEEQLQILHQRGVRFEDSERCRSILAAVSYYRLTAYFLPFKDKGGGYNGVAFERVYQIYEFDRKLRRILFSAVVVFKLSGKIAKKVECPLKSISAMESLNSGCRCESWIKRKRIFFAALKKQNALILNCCLKRIKIVPAK